MASARRGGCSGRPWPERKEGPVNDRAFSVVCGAFNGYNIDARSPRPSSPERGLRHRQEYLPMPRKLTLFDRFWVKVDKNGPPPPHRPELGPCWLWLGQIDHKGYGRVSVDNRMRRAHQTSYVFAFGPVPDGLSVLHHCDVRRCVRPYHLYAGTALNNTHDAIERGRARYANMLVGECKRGHPCTPENIITVTRTIGSTQRRCRLCRSIEQAKVKQAARERAKTSGRVV